MKNPLFCINYDARAKYICTCESENKRLIGKGDFPIAVLAGDMFDILKCEEMLC
jgi:hypothetical protein